MMNDGVVNEKFEKKSQKINRQKIKDGLMKKIEKTHFLEQHKDKNEIPFVSPVATTYNEEFLNFSQKNRFEKIKYKLLELKMIIENDEENEIQIVKEVFIN